MKLSDITFRTILFGLVQLLRHTARRHPAFKERLAEKNFTAQIKVKDNSIGRYITFRNGKIISKSGIHPDPDVVMTYDNSEVASRLMVPNRDQQEQIDAIKNFLITMEGPDDLSSWFMMTLSEMMSLGIDYGIDMGKGIKRYTSGTNAGPVFVYVKEGKIVRITPIDFDKDDPDPWEIEARGKKFSPPRKTTLSPYGFSLKSLVYSPDRILYPMKRVDFDPGGERNCEQRGISGYERISWDEAADIVADEIKRVKRDYGPGAIFYSHGSHHMWGNVGYYLSCARRFFNTIGATLNVHNPDSWEGWYWGAMHHLGHSISLGLPEPYGTVEDVLKNCEMMVFWSSDPEATAGAYGAMEGTIRRQWLKEQGIKLVHIDPFYNHTAAWLGGKWLAPRPATGNSLALAIAHVWITEDLYDKEYIAKNTTGFEQWKDYILGKEDGVPKTPEWQESESAIPAKDVRALAREWGSKRTYLAAGGAGMGLGGACRDATGIEWARSMVCLAAMQGLGKPGVHLGNMQVATPLSTTFFFPGYAEGGMSGDLAGTALAVNMYQRMPQLPTMSPVSQRIPRLKIPEAILDGHCEGYPTDTLSIEGQFQKFEYPKPGHSPVRMYYKYGGSYIGTMSETNRYVRAYRTDKLDFVVNQSIWFEGEAKFADIILPACTSFERWDIGEFAHAGGYVMHSFLQCNHRVMVMQHKCIEPLGESKSDYEIFLEIAKRLGLAAPYSEGMSQFDWCKRLFDATDLPKVIPWKKFLKKGYYVVPPPRKDEKGEYGPFGLRWFAENRKKDTPNMAPLPGDYTEEFGRGLQTQSGKFEFVCSSLQRFDPNDPERPTMTKYIPAWEGHHTKDIYDKYPLFLVSPHPRFSFHTHNDGKDGFMNDVKDHRMLIDDYYYWIARINPKDAGERNIGDRDLVKLFNDRGVVICAAQVTERVPAGTVHSYESSAVYDPVGEPGHSPDRGGCINLLTSKRDIIKKSHSMSAVSSLIQIEKWEGGA
jgi:molybdopterin guanine dinucleotide-containing S/N-oxide reductase-like protein